MRTAVKSPAQINHARRLKTRYLLRCIYFILFYSLSQVLLQDVRGLNPAERVEDGYGSKLDSAEQMKR